MRRLLLIVTAILLGCSPEDPAPPPQLLLYVDTDAPVPLPPADPPDDSYVPLFDSLLVELVLPGDQAPCDGCVREFYVDRGQFRRRAVSFGIPRSSTLADARARITLFHGSARRLGEPPPPASLQSTISLASVDSGVVEMHVVLETDNVGVPQGTLAAPAQARPGRPERSRVATWRGVARTPCEGTPNPGEACVPGGAFWMGSSAPGQFEHLVLLSPYFMSLSEVTVGQFRSSGVSSAPLGRWSGSSSGDSDADYCTYTDAPGPHEGMPLNCVPWDAARAYCQAMGGDLPTEAQYEYAARGLKSYNFVWGRDPPSCEDTVFGRVGYGMFEDRAASCKPDIPPGGPLPAGSGRRDRLALTGSEIVDLVGNVSEFCLDYFQEVQGPFWGTPMLFEDPRCDDPDLEPSRVAVGTNWGWSNADRVAHTRGRWPEPTPALSTMIGFRCVRPG